MPGSLTAPRGAGARASAPGRVAFRSSHSVGTSGRITFAAQWLAYALPCRRFAFALAGNDARLGADVDRYSFIVVDLHHLLLAGLPAHAKHNPPTPMYQNGVLRFLILLSHKVAAVEAENQIIEEIQILALGGPDESRSGRR